MMDYPLLNDTLLGVTLFPHGSIVAGLKSQLLSALGGPPERWVGHWVDTRLCVCFLQVEEEQMSLVLLLRQHAPVPLLSAASPLLKGAWMQSADFQLPVTSVLRGAFSPKILDSSQIQRERNVLDWDFFLNDNSFFVCLCCKTRFKNNFLLKILNMFMHLY